MARVSQGWLRTVNTLPWPARTPDLSPLEHIWDHLVRRVSHPTSVNELEARLQEIWNEMSQDIIQILYDSMPDRIASCIRAMRVQQGKVTGFHKIRFQIPVPHSETHSELTFGAPAREISATRGNDSDNRRAGLEREVILPYSGKVKGVSEIRFSFPAPRHNRDLLPEAQSLQVQFLEGGH
ncbi:transposable element Tcb1 transposase [Trichonephila clavipes]|nr:transposable element Tcb1 transposase [Trichonephila clavipes]